MALELPPSSPPDPMTFGLTPERAHFYLTPPKGFNFPLLIVVIAAAAASFLLARLLPTEASGVIGVISFPVWVGLGWLAGEWLGEAVVVFRERARTHLPDHPAFLRYQAALDGYQDTQDEVESLSWMEEQRWKELDGWAFEKKLSDLLREQSWDVERTKGSGDEGVDIVLRAADKTVIVQCKTNAKPLGPAPVRELYGTLQHQGASEGWLVSTSGFSSGAQAFAEGKPIRLLTIGELLRGAKASALLSLGDTVGNQQEAPILAAGRPPEEAEPRDATAQSLALMSAKGRAGRLVRAASRDPAQAAARYRTAAEHGNTDAQFRLFLMYTDGQGVAKDDVEALKWLTLVAIRVGKKRKTYALMRDSCVRKMTPAQIAEAQKRASDWMAAYEGRKK